MLITTEADEIISSLSSSIGKWESQIQRATALTPDDMATAAREAKASGYEDIKLYWVHRGKEAATSLARRRELIRWVQDKDDNDLTDQKGKA